MQANASGLGNTALGVQVLYFNTIGSEYTDPSQYKDYILTMLFLKYVSDVHKDISQKCLTKYKGDVDRAQRAMKLERFIVPEDSSFDHLYGSRNESNIGELIDVALANLEEANRDKLSSEDVLFSETFLLTAVTLATQMTRTVD